MLATDPLTKTDIFRFPIVTKHLIANFVLVAFAATLVILRFVARRIRKTKIWYVEPADSFHDLRADTPSGGMMLLLSPR